MWRPAILQKVEAVVLDEKANKLLGVAKVLDQVLGDGGFNAWLAREGVPSDVPPERRVHSLARALSGVTEELARAFPSVGLGYYDVLCDRIVAYAPSSRLGFLVGVSPPPDHLGRAAMLEGRDKIAVGSMVRGDALNCMHPLIRGDRTIGFAFANESLEDIYKQLNAGGRSAQSSEFAAVLGLSSLIAFASTATLSADAVEADLLAAAAGGRLPVEPVQMLLSGLRQIQRYIQLFFNNLHAGVLLVDQAGIVEYCSRPMARLTGLEPAMAVGRPWRAVAAELGLEPGRLEAPPGPDSHPLVVSVTLPGTGGSPAVVNVTATSLPAPDGTAARVLYLFEDQNSVHDESAYFERAERLAMAGELATSIAHEIRNPLTVVAGSVQLIPQRLTDAEFLLSFSRIAGEELARVNRIIQGLLGFARYSEPDMQPLDLGQLVNQASDVVHWYARKHGVELRVEPPPAAARVHGDAEHLLQALLNLMMNGIQAMAEGGTLTVRVEQPGASRLVRILVSDTGVGIPPERLPKIWEVFYSSKPGGTGLGLPVVQRVVDQHRGFVSVESRPGEGTTFAIMLPLITGPYLPAEE